MAASVSDKKEESLVIASNQFVRQVISESIELVTMNRRMSSFESGK